MNSNIIMEFLIVPGGMHKQGLLVLNQQAPEGEMGGFVVDFNQEGKVKMLNITIQSFF